MSFTAVDVAKRQIAAPRGVINASPTDISSSGAAWLIYTLSIYIQMEMTCVVMEIGMHAHIMPPHHFVVRLAAAYSK